MLCSLETGIKSSSSGEELSGLDKEHHQHLDLEDKVGSKFRNLQRKWELLSGRDSIARDPSDTSPVKSKYSTIIFFLYLFYIHFHFIL